jgi:hypothetical protein
VVLFSRPAGRQTYLTPWRTRSMPVGSIAARGDSSGATLLNEAQIDTAALTPGRYTASVVVLQDNQPVGRVSRVFEIIPAVK